tara:strand:+ start:415 stop:816 length:402 start_codon:yes stop_codon:yes gene_type:complete
MNKKILLASFIFPERLEWFLTYLENKFDIPRETVFVYKNHDDESKLIVTFKFIIKDGKRINFKSLFPNAILIHKKGNTIYTINALNKLIESLEEGNIGNIDYKSIIIDWDQHQNKLILTNNGELVIFDIEKVF